MAHRDAVHRRCLIIHRTVCFEAHMWWCDPVTQDSSCPVSVQPCNCTSRQQGRLESLTATKTAATPPSHTPIRHAVKTGDQSDTHASQTDWHAPGGARCQTLGTGDERARCAGGGAQREWRSGPAPRAACPLTRLRVCQHVPVWATSRALDVTQGLLGTQDKRCASYVCGAAGSSRPHQPGNAPHISYRILHMRYTCWASLRHSN